MNTPNINSGPNAGGTPGKGGEILPGRRTGRAAARNGAEGPPEAARGNAAPEPAPVQPAADSYQATREREFVRELTDRAVGMEPPIREEAVERARRRVSEGFYNKAEFLGDLATRLINTD